MRCTSTTTGGRNAVDARRQRGSREKLVKGFLQPSCTPDDLDKSLSSLNVGRACGVRSHVSCFGSVNVRAEAMLGHTRSGLDCEDALWPQRFTVPEQTMNGGLMLTNQTRERRLRPDFTDCFGKRRI